MFVCGYACSDDIFIAMTSCVKPVGCDDVDACH